MRRLLLSWLLLAVLGLPVQGASQDLTVEIGTYEKPEVIHLEVQPWGSGGWTEESLDTLQATRPGRMPGYDFFYGYEQHCLVPRSEDYCYLHLFLADPRQRPADGFRRVWHQTFLMTVKGSFVDQAVTLPVKVMAGSDPASVRTGTLEVVAHSSYPIGLVLPEPSKDLELSTSSASVHDLFFANRSTCCEIRLVKAKVSSREQSLWSTLETEENEKALQPEGDKTFQPWLSLKLHPSASQAFWASFPPYDAKKPHDTLKLDLLFQVQGGREARIQQDVRVRFKPPFLMVVLSVVLGALMASAISLVVMSKHSEKGPEVAFGNAETPLGKLLEASKRILLSVLVSVAVFFLYQVVKGEKDVILFGFSLDPYQCLPSFVIGLLVGSRPDFYYRKLIERRSGPGGESPEPARAAIWLAVLLGMMTPVCAQATKPDFRPISLDYDEKADVLYVLSSPANRIYRLEPVSGRLQEIVDLGPAVGYGGAATDACLIRWGGAPWVASLVSRRLNLDDLWQVTVALSPAAGGTRVSTRRIGGFGQFHAIAFDEDNARLLLSDRIREGVYAAPLTAQGIGEPKLVFRHRLVSEPTAIIARPAGVFVASRPRRTVYRVDLATGTLTALVKDLLDPAAIAVSLDGGRLLVVDAGEAQVLEHSFATGSQRVLLDGSPLREPRAIQVDRRGHLWVADAWARVIFEFSPEGKLLRRHSPPR